MPDQSAVAGATGGATGIVRAIDYLTASNRTGFGDRVPEFESGELNAEGKRVVVVDDSIVRGTTIRKLIRMVRENGAKEVHLRIGSPPIRHSCYYGIDTPLQEELVAAKQSVEEIRRFINADSLRYLSLGTMLAAGPASRDEVCTACWTKEYPVQLPRPLSLYDRAPDGSWGSFLVKPIGPGTRALCDVGPGDDLHRSRVILAVGKIDEGSRRFAQVANLGVPRNPYNHQLFIVSA